MKTYFLIIFASTRAFLKTRTAISQHHIPHEVQTTPTYLNPECGMCLKIEDNYREDAQKIIPCKEEAIIIDYDEE